VTVDIPRPTTLAERKRQKTVFRQLQIACGGQEACAAMTRGCAKTHSDWAHPDKMHYFAGIDVVADYEAIAPFPLVTAHLAEMRGYVLVKADDIGKDPLESETGPWTASLMKEVGEVLQASSHRITEGTNADTLAKVRSEIADAIRVLVTADRQLKALQGGVDG